MTDSWRTLQRSGSSSTLTRYKLDVRRVKGTPLARVKLAELSPRHVQTFINDLSKSGLSPQSVRHCRSVLRTALTQAEKWEMVHRNAARLTDPPRVPHHEIEAMSPDQARAVIAAFAGHSHEFLVITALMTGLRQGELVGLRWEDVDLVGCKLTVRYQLQRIDGKLTPTEPKSDNARRTIPLVPWAFDALKAERTRQLENQLLAGARWHETPYIFTSTIGTPLPGSTVSNRFRLHLKVAGLPPMRFHDLRHGTASLLLACGVELRIIQAILGHSDLGTTSRYAHVSRKLMWAAADGLHNLLTGTA